MITKVVIPKMGMSTVEVDLTQIFVKVGDKIKAGDPVAEVESEKANFTIESEVSGTVTELYLQPNATADIGTAICAIETE